MFALLPTSLQHAALKRRWGDLRVGAAGMEAAKPSLPIGKRIQGRVYVSEARR